MVEKVLEIGGVKHTFRTELETLKLLNDWVKGTKTSEQYITWLQNRDINSEEYSNLYVEWLLDQKITHTIVGADGKKQTTSYTDI